MKHGPLEEEILFGHYHVQVPYVPFKFSGTVPSAHLLFMICLGRIFS